MNRDFWYRRRVFVTGHTGFKGSWFTFWLHRLGADLLGYSLPPPTTPNAHLAMGLDNLLSAIAGDVRDLPGLTLALREHRPEIVFHFAAQSLVRPSYRDPVDTYATNVMGTINLLEACRRTPGIRAVIVVTSDKCYANHENAQGYCEEDALGGLDPYSSSKSCAELVASTYRHLFKSDGGSGCHTGIHMASVRAGNVIGGGDWSADRLVPDIIRALFAHEPLLIRNPAAIRPWQHVLEPLHGYAVLAERLYTHGEKYAEAWNFGPDLDSAQPVATVIDKLIKMWDSQLCWTRDDGPHPLETSCLRLNSSKSRTRLGWRPLLSLDETLQWVTEWYQGYQAGLDMTEITKKQICKYELLSNLNP